MYKRLIALFFLIVPLGLSGQSLENIGTTDNHKAGIKSLILSDRTILQLNSDRPLFSFRLNNLLFKSDDVPSVQSDSSLLVSFPHGLEAEYFSRGGSHPGWMAEIVFRNNGKDTLSISDVVPFAENSENTYITGKGPWDLARAWLFRPGYSPVRVILPDNAWEIGFTAFKVNERMSVSAIARRKTVTEGKKSRYETAIYPGGSVRYKIYGDIYSGSWQDGLRLMFQNRHLYDLDHFDNSLYERSDLNWIKKSYLIVLQMTWDREYYDRFSGHYGFDSILTKYNRLFGNIDVYGIWPTWPRLGLDESNQWDMYGKLPGGLRKIREFSRQARLSNTRFFIEYNPWDKSTRSENQFSGMARLISATDADGVVLDTQGSSSYDLQHAADSVRKGVIMYSEGMAVVKDMPGIISGRVHNAIFLSPELNLNKLIKPDFSIFRVCDVGEDILRREISIAFFNGYGTELNLFRPGKRDGDYKNDLDYLAKTTFILRQNNDAFLDFSWTPLIDTKADRTFVNMWKTDKKTLYTVLNMDYKGIDTTLFQVNPSDEYHYVSLWRHTEIDPEISEGKYYIRVKADGWSPAFEGTRRESSIDCIASLPRLISAEIRHNQISIKTNSIGILNIWKGDPGYGAVPLQLQAPVDTLLNAGNLFTSEGDHIVIQLTDSGLLCDECVLSTKNGTPLIVSAHHSTQRASFVPEGMVLIPAATITYRLHSNDEFIAYPSTEKDITVRVDSILMDIYPVTNEEYYRFVSSSKYIPSDTANYLHNWTNGRYRKGEENYPVVYISYEDAKAYADWAGKRLPSEAEWQLAAQGTDKRLWPWGNSFSVSKCNSGIGKMTRVNAYPKGKSPYGVADLTGNVWQMTDDIFFNGIYYFMIIRGGSYFKPESSFWYIQGGPQQLDHTQMQLLVSPGFDRSATVGFRCVKDVVPGFHSR